MSKKINISKKDLIELYIKNHKTLLQISKLYNTNATTVMDRMKEYRISRHKRGFNLLKRFYVNIYADYKHFKSFIGTMSKEKINWLTGFYEGEGNVRTLGEKYHNMQFCITQKDKSSLIFIKKLLNTGSITRDGNCYKYNIYKTGYSLALLEKMSLYMKSKVRIIKASKCINHLCFIKESVERE